MAKWDWAGRPRPSDQLFYAGRVDRSDGLSGLDQAQRRAVTSPSPTLCILAGAGSGKTRVLTRRIARRCLDADADARHVLALTFTRKAAGELSNRLAGLGLRDRPAAGTFHATAHAQLRHWWAGADRRPPALLESRNRLLGRVIGPGPVRPAVVSAEIEWARARGLTPAAYAEAAVQAHRTPPTDPERVSRWFAAYEDEKRKRGVVDFDDLLVLCADALETDHDFALAQRWRFRHLFVDEFQDVNPLQFRLLQAWLGDGTEPDLCVVGDPNQAIYRWNGADPSYLTRFADHFPGAEVVELTDNYRSAPQVLAVAASVLAGPHRVPRPLRAHRQDEPAPAVVAYADEDAEASGVARALHDRRDPRVPWAAQAVLVRTNAQTLPIEAALRRARIPYRVRGRSAFLDDPLARSTLAELARCRRPFATELADLEAALADGSVSLSASLGSGAHDDSEGAVDNTDDQRAVMSTLVQLGHELLRLDPHAVASAFPTWVAAAIHREGADHTGDAVELVSFHAAKGLEWPIVHIAGCEDGFAPIRHVADDLAAAEEERRLFYVAVTRAERQVRFTWASSRRFGTRALRRRRSPYLDQVLATTAVLAEASARAEPRTVAAALATGRSELASRSPARREPTADPVRRALLDDLRRWRHQQAAGVGLTDQVILSDRALHAVAERQPRHPDQLRDLPGIGLLKQAEYGADLLHLVAVHLVSQAGAPTTGTG